MKILIKNKIKLMSLMIRTSNTNKKIVTLASKSSKKRKIIKPFKQNLNIRLNHFRQIMRKYNKNFKKNWTRHRIRSINFRLRLRKKCNNMKSFKLNSKRQMNRFNYFKFRMKKYKVLLTGLLKMWLNLLLKIRK